MADGSHIGLFRFPMSSSSSSRTSAATPPAPAATTAGSTTHSVEKSPRAKGRPAKAGGVAGRHIVSCQLCGKTFNNSSALAKHKLTHSDERKYICQLCSKAFKRQDHLNGHMMTHRSKKPFQCKFDGCDKSYCDARSLRRHLDNHHAQVLPSVGGSADSSSVFQFDSGKHPPSSTNPSRWGMINTPAHSSSYLSQVSPISPAPGAPRPSSPSALHHWSYQHPFSEPKNSECTICHKRFKNIPALNGHMRLHGGYFKKQDEDLNIAQTEQRVVPESKPLQSVANTTPATVTTVNSAHVVVSTAKSIATQSAISQKHSTLTNILKSGGLHVNDPNSVSPISVAVSKILEMHSTATTTKTKLKGNTNSVLSDIRTCSTSKVVSSVDVLSGPASTNCKASVKKSLQRIPALSSEPVSLVNYPTTTSFTHLDSTSYCQNESMLPIEPAVTAQSSTIINGSNVNNHQAQYHIDHSGHIVIQPNPLSPHYANPHNAHSALSPHVQHTPLNSPALQHMSHPNTPNYPTTPNHPNTPGHQPQQMFKFPPTNYPSAPSNSPNHLSIQVSHHGVPIQPSPSQMNQVQPSPGHIAPVPASPGHMVSISPSNMISVPPSNLVAQHSVPTQGHLQSTPLSTGQVAPVPPSPSYVTPIPQSPGYLNPVPPSPSLVSNIPLSSSHLTVVPPSPGHMGPVPPSPGHMGPVPPSPSHVGPVPPSPGHVGSVPPSPSLIGNVPHPNRHIFSSNQINPGQINSGQAGNLTCGVVPPSPGHINPVPPSPGHINPVPQSPHVVNSLISGQINSLLPDTNNVAFSDTQESFLSPVSNDHLPGSDQGMQIPTIQLDPPPLSLHHRSNVVQQSQTNDLVNSLPSHNAAYSQLDAAAEQICNDKLFKETSKVFQEQLPSLAVVAAAAENENSSLFLPNATTSLPEHSGSTPNDIIEPTLSNQSVIDQNELFSELEKLQHFSKSDFDQSFFDPDQTDPPTRKRHSSADPDFCSKHISSHHDDTVMMLLNQAHVQKKNGKSNTLSSEVLDLITSKLNLDQLNPSFPPSNFKHIACKPPSKPSGKPISKKILRFAEDSAEGVKITQPECEPASQQKSIKNGLEAKSPALSPVVTEKSVDSVFKTPMGVLPPSNAPSTPRAKRKHRPEPLIIPPNLNHSAFQSRLRSPRLYDSCTPAVRHQTPPPYTPPPMLSPVRSGSGLFWSIQSNFRPTTPKSAPLTPRPLRRLSHKDSIIDDEIDEEEDSAPPETDIQPHVNIGSNYQAELPIFNPCKRDALNTPSREDLVWDPCVVDDLTESEVRNYEDFSCCGAVSGNGVNKEYALHLLFFAGGDIKRAMLQLMTLQPKLSCNHILQTYIYRESTLWSRSEIEAYHRALVKCDKDFFKISNEISSKNVKECVQFYYLWKKVCTDEYRRVRTMRRKREQEELYNLRNKVHDSSPSPHKNSPKLSPRPTHKQNGFPEDFNPVLFKCEFPGCTSSFSSRQALNGHVRIHGGNHVRDVVSEGSDSQSDSVDFYHFSPQTAGTMASPDSSSISPSPSRSDAADDDQEFSCRICNRKFNKARSRNAHMKSHSRSAIDAP